MSILLVPTELLMKILSYNCISISDMFHVMSTCSELNQIIRDLNGLWRLKFTEKWPRIHFGEEDKNAASWLERIHSRIRLGEEIKALIQSMSPLCYPHGVKAFTPQRVVDKLMDLLQQNPLFVEDEIASLSFESENLTTQHYARHLLKKVRTPMLEKKWMDFNERRGLDINEQPESKQTIWVEGALLIAQWINMEERELPRFEVLDGVFNEITQRVKTLVLDAKLPSSSKILSIISHVLFHEMRLSVVGITDYTPFTKSYWVDGMIQTYCIDEVLLSMRQERCRWMPMPSECHVTIMCIIYQEVARRMGIDCEPVFYVSNHLHEFSREFRDTEILFLLRCREFSKDDDGEFIYINMRDHKASLKRPNSSGHLGPYTEVGETVYYKVETREPPASVDWVFRGILNHLIDYALHPSHECFMDYRGLKYSKLSNAFDYHAPYRYYIFDVNEYIGKALGHRLELDDALDHFQIFQNESFDSKEEIENEFREKLTEAQTKFNSPVFPQHRSPTLKYAVGIVVFYRTGIIEENEGVSVIISWDVKPHCKSNQPRYQVLPLSLFVYTNDRHQIRTIEQDKLELFPDSASIRFDHPELGLHFEKFDGRRFVPNAEKKRHYPEDEAFALSLLGN